MGTMTSPLARRRPATLPAGQSPEHALILALARGEDRDAAIRALVAAADAQTLTSELRRLRLLELLGRRLTEIARAPELDPRFVAAVDEQVAFTRRDSLSKQMLTWRLLTMLRASGVTAIPLKGPFLAERLHGDAGARGSHDIDLLVAAHEMRRAVAVVEGAGYVRPRVSDELPRLHHIFEADDAPPVELHWRLHWYEAEYATELLERTVADGDVRRPAPADDFLSLLLFYARDGLLGLKAPLDIAAWWSLYGSELDPGELHAILRRHPALARPAAAAALAAESVLGVPVASCLEPAVLRRRRSAAAVRLVDWAEVRSEGEVDVATKIVDGLLTPPTGTLAFIQRAAFPGMPGSPWTAPLQQLLYFGHLLRHGAPIAARAIRGGPPRPHASRRA
jgi:hypothetical protein